MIAWSRRAAAAGLGPWAGCLVVAMATIPAAAGAQDAPCVSLPEYTLDAEVPGLVARDSSRAAPVQGGGLILTETVRVGSDDRLGSIRAFCTRGDVSEGYPWHWAPLEGEWNQTRSRWRVHWDGGGS